VTKNENTALIVFSGYNTRAILPLLATLSSMNLRFGIISLDDSDLINNTAYRDKIIFTRNNKNLQIDILIKCIKSYIKDEGLDCAYIAPSTEFLNEWLLINRDKLLDNKIKAPLVGHDLYESITNKLSFGRLCADNGIKIPKEYSLSEALKLNMKLVAKPKSNISSGLSMYPIILNRGSHDLDNFLKNHDGNDYFYQEYVSGDSLYLLYYFSISGTVYSLSQQNFVQEPEGKSMLYSRLSDIHEKPISSKFIRLFKKVGFKGLVMVELKYFNNLYYMIEANPRLWGPSQLFVDSGYNIFIPFLKDIFGDAKININIKVSDYNAEYSWVGGINSHKSSELTYYSGFTHEKLARMMGELEALDVYSRYML
jgi:predicted ATP-grasp superfamily ATP-dependent carboligase